MLAGSQPPNATPPLYGLDTIYASIDKVWTCFSLPFFLLHHFTFFDTKFTRRKNSKLLSPSLQVFFSVYFFKIIIKNLIILWANHFRHPKVSFIILGINY